jgi:hypothetical protein
MGFTNMPDDVNTLLDGFRRRLEAPERTNQTGF